MGQQSMGEMQLVSTFQRHIRDHAPELAAQTASALIKINSENAQYWAMRSDARMQTGSPQDALEDIAQANALAPDMPAYLTAFGQVLVALDDKDSAEACFLRALQLDDSFLRALLGIGSLYEKTGRSGEASGFVLKAVQDHPESAAACHAAGRFLHNFGERTDAAQFFAKAIENDPKLPEPYRVLAGYLREADDIPSAIAMYDGLLRHNPEDQMTLAERAHCLAHLNDWTHRGYSRFNPSTPAQLRSGASPFLYLPFEDNAANARTRSEIYARKLVGGVTAAQVAPHSNEKLRIGYFSADFHDHATMHLLAGVLESHDTDKVEVFAYSYGPDKQDHMRQRAEQACAQFVDIRGLDDFSAAELARQHKIDVAVDLKGFTAGTRIKLFAHRAAPVQVAWLGFPGTTGARCMDYMIADSVTVPPDLEQHYSEKIIALPGCYQPNDRSRPLPDPNARRVDHGLPEDGFVFCSFNSSYKVSPREFDIWMQLLHEVDGSVLWQLDGGDISRTRLRGAAMARGIDPDRIIFAERVSQAEHLARLALADLFLDTFNCNAHTTASDALWAGVPVVTVLGEQFAARVAASLCTAAGTPETICDSPETYQTMALALARDTTALGALRQRLVDGRDNCVLFDTEEFTRTLEEAFLRIAKRGD